MKELRTSAERIEREAWMDLYRGAGREVRRRLGLGVKEHGDVTFLSASRADHLLLNRAIGLGTTVRADIRAVDAALRHFEQNGTKRFWVHMGSQLRYSTLPAILEERGIVPYPRSWMKFVRPSAPVERISCDVEIRDARAEDAPRLGQLLAAGFDLPPHAAGVLSSAVGRKHWTYVVAEDAGEIVAAGALYVKGADGYLVFAATARGSRRKGCQGALMAARLNRAQRLGCRRVFTETGMPVAGEPSSSYRNMLRAGFDELHVRDNFAPEGTRWQSPSSSVAIQKLDASPKRWRSLRRVAARSGS